jgi:Flp pilus assembly protein TadD
MDDVGTARLSTVVLGALALGAAVAMLPAPVCGAPSDDVADAKRLIRHGKPALAIPVLSADHARDPADSSVTIVLAQAYALSGDGAMAIELLEPVISQHRDNAAARAVLGETYALNGDLAGAEEQFKLALAADPSQTDAQDGLARAYALTGRSEEARKLYDATLAAHPDDFAAFGGRADLEAVAGDLRNARGDYRAALAIEPDDTQALVGLARVQMRLGDFAGGEQSVEHALALAPGDTDALQIQAALRQRFAPSVETNFEQIVGNGIVQSRGGVAALWFADPRVQLGIAASRFTLSGGNAQASADRFGITAAYTGAAGNQVSLDLRRSQFARWSPTVDADLTLTGKSRDVGYRLGFGTGGIDTAPGARENLIAASGAGIRIDDLFADLHAESRPYLFHAGARFAGFSDNNRYREGTFDVARRFPIGSSAYFALIAAARLAGFEDNYSAVQSHGYYDYTAQRDVKLAAFASAQLGRRSSAGIVSEVGQRRTTLVLGSTAQQSFSRFTPFFDIIAGPLTFSAQDVIARYGVVPGVPGYYSNALRVQARLRV